MFPVKKIVQKMFEKNSGFDVKQCPREKTNFLFSRIFKTFSFWQKNWELAHNSSKFLDFPDFS